MGRTGSARAYARAALLGNPSDLHGGRVLAFTFRDLHVDATAADGAAAPAERRGGLVDAALEVLAERLGEPRATELRVSCETTIPREVGLGGSSAIVIATLRAGCAALGARLEPDELAAMALRAETERLGIVAGPQDRVVQAHQGLLLMDFADGTVERLDATVLSRLFVAWLEGAGHPSSRVHAGASADLAEAEANGVMSELAELASRGAAALAAGDLVALGELLARNFELRQGMYDLDPRHVRMVELAGEHGAPASYAGSGGAVVGLAPEEHAYARLRDAFGREGITMIRPRPTAGRSR